MKKKLFACLVVGMMMSAMSGMASASSITWDPEDFLINSNNSSVIHFFDITASPYLFNPGVSGSVGVDTLTFAQLEIWAYDDDDNAAEKFKITVDIDPEIINQTVTSSSTVSSMISDITVISSLQPDGKISVTFNQQAGDFYFDKGVLYFDFTAYSDPTGGPEANPVPEPATMLLFGTGLAGLAGFARRKKK